MLDFAVNLFNPHDVITNGGLFLLFIMIFAESGMMVGMFFPGDTLLFLAGILGASGNISIVGALCTVAAAAILGDNIGYLIGRTVGHKLFKKDAVIFREEYVERAQKFFAKYGNRAMLFAHFFPVVRSFAPVTAGAGEMNHKMFFIYDAIGDIAWTLLITLLGYFLGSRIPGVEKFIEPVLVLVILAVLVPTVFHALRDPHVRAALKRRFSKKS